MDAGVVTIDASCQGVVSLCTVNCGVLGGQGK